MDNSFLSLLSESSEPALVVVDIQRSYEQGCMLLMPKAIEKINNTTQNIFFFYVGVSAGCDHKDDVIGFLLEYGLDEYKLDQITFIEKDYGFYRNWMDEGIDQSVILKAISLMNEHQLKDSRQLTETQLNYVLKGHEQHRYFVLENPIVAPRMYDKKLREANLTQVELMGGGRFECLEEINIYLQSLGIKTSVTEDLCFSGNEYSLEVRKTKKKNRHRV